MKKIFTILLMLTMYSSFSQTAPKLYFNLTSHNEMSSTEPYDTAPTYTFYKQTRDTIRKIVDLVYAKGAKYNLETCQKFVFGCLHAELAATTSTDIIEYAHKLGGAPYGNVVQIDPRYKITPLTTYTYNIADVAHLIDSTGGASSKVLGGFLAYSGTVAATAWSLGDWTTYTTTINGTFNKPWKADIMWGPGSNPPHTHDINNYGIWKPRGKNDSIDFFCHDPGQTIWVQGNGCGWNLTPTISVQTIISQIRTEATKIANGTYPANKFYSGSVIFNFKDLNNSAYPTFQMRKELTTLIDSINVMVAQKKIVWTTITQKQDTFNLWSTTKGIAYSQWACGQTTTIAPTCAVSSVKEFEKDDGFLKVYPNPAKDELSYELQSLTGKETYFYVYDNLGREVLKKQITEPVGKIFLDNLPVGIYMINTTSTRPKKLLITK